MKSVGEGEAVVAAVTVEDRHSRIVNWFGKTVRHHLIAVGVLQIFSGVLNSFMTIFFTCLYNRCSLYLMSSLWPCPFYFICGIFAIEIQKRPARHKVSSLMALNIFSLILGLCAGVIHVLQMSLLHLFMLTTVQVIIALLTLLGMVSSMYCLILICLSFERYQLRYKVRYRRLTEELNENDTT
ncbi:uncharacterized protein si:dkey-30c15.13 [Polypterus senegalus]|uniref:uncharacterized protein si:dkey-30c15.13 n=1 Tax=Polypterus senegalus TaxID=55291 RepID=UPI001965C508|nr:uncharacterized protein si:dkey-30c15.13 [Polypterus senegalus]XP_039601056.1 uncharacterized protein si:dkey-30c15.13 [Polypterus senegalus]XP_039601066.1 uncharacterized protein si:dkey-30c15.13 [Polypterus senegalus]